MFFLKWEVDRRSRSALETWKFQWSWLWLTIAFLSRAVCSSGGNCCLRKNFHSFCCVQQFFSFYPRICSRKTHNFAKLYRNFQFDGTFKEMRWYFQPKLGILRKNWKIFLQQNYMILYFHISAENTPNREKTDVKEKNLFFFFSFRKRKFKLNIFSINCQLFTNFPLLHDFSSLNKHI